MTNQRLLFVVTPYLLWCLYWLVVALGMIPTSLSVETVRLVAVLNICITLGIFLGLVTIRRIDHRSHKEMRRFQHDFSGYADDPNEDLSETAGEGFDSWTDQQGNKLILLKRRRR